MRCIDESMEARPSISSAYHESDQASIESSCNQNTLVNIDVWVDSATIGTAKESRPIPIHFETSPLIMSISSNGASSSSSMNNRIPRTNVNKALCTPKSITNAKR